MLKAVSCCTKADKPAPEPPPSRDSLSSPGAAIIPDEHPNSAPEAADDPQENAVYLAIEEDTGSVYEEPQPSVPEPAPIIIDDTEDLSLHPMSEIIDELKKKGKSFRNNVPEKDQNYVEFEEGENQDGIDGYVPMGGTSNPQNCYYNQAFTPDENVTPDYVNTEEFLDGVPPSNHDDEANKLQYQNVDVDEKGITPSGEDKRTSAMSDVIKQMKENLSGGNKSGKVMEAVNRINKSQSSEKDIDSEDEDPSHDYVNDDEHPSWTTCITPNIIVPGHEAPPVQQKPKKTLRHRGSDPAKTNHERYENTSVQRQRFQSTNVFQSTRNSERKPTGVHFRPRKVPETLQESQEDTKSKLVSNDLKSIIQSRRPQVRLQSEIYEDVTRDKDGIRPVLGHSEEESEDEKPPSAAGHTIGTTQWGPSYVNAGNGAINAEVKSTLSCAQTTKEFKGLNFQNTSLVKKQTERDSTELPPPNLTCERSSQDSYVNVPSPAAIPPPSAIGHISATSKEPYVNVQNRPKCTQSILILEKDQKPLNRERESSEEYESDDSDDIVYEDDFVLNNAGGTDTAPSLPVKKGSIISKQPAGFGGISPGSIKTLDENEEDEDDDNVYEDTEEVLREVEGIRSGEADKELAFPDIHLNRNHFNASRKSKGSVNQEEEEEQESLNGDLEGPVLPQRQREKSSTSLPSGTKEEVKINDNKRDDIYESIEVPPLNPHRATSSKTKANTLPSDSNKIADSEMTKSTPNVFNKISMFNKSADKKEKITPKKETIKKTEPTPAVSKDEQKINMAHRPPMTLPKPLTNFSVSSPDLRTGLDIPKVGSGINTVQRRKVKTIEEELSARLALLKMQKEWNQ